MRDAIETVLVSAAFLGALFAVCYVLAFFTSPWVQHAWDSTVRLYRRWNRKRAGRSGGTETAGAAPEKCDKCGVRGHGLFVAAFNATRGRQFTFCLECAAGIPTSPGSDRSVLEAALQSCREEDRLGRMGAESGGSGSPDTARGCGDQAVSPDDQQPARCPDSLRGKSGGAHRH